MRFKGGILRGIISPFSSPRNTKEHGYFCGYSAYSAYSAGVFYNIEIIEEIKKKNEK